MEFQTICVSAPVNIALTKYWGKIDELNIHPMTSSVSITLNKNQLHTRTIVRTSKSLTTSSFILNGRSCDLPSKLKDMIIVAQLKARLAGKDIPRFIQIESENNFPTAAGLASSASGTAALAFALCNLYGLKVDMACIARRGSGSGCRSLYGGFVHWVSHPPDNHTQKINDELSSIRQIYPKSYWPQLKILICVIDSQTKRWGSTNGMQRTVETSLLYKYGRSESVKQNEKELLDALSTRDFPRLAEITMKESNQLHAVCLDTWPPIVYLNQTSYSLMHFVYLINNYFKRTLLGYTFDAGPNCFLLAEVQDIPLIVKLLTICYGSGNACGDSDEYVSVSDDATNNRTFLKLLGIQYPIPEDKIDPDLLNQLPHLNGSILYVISTEVGDGPEILECTNESL